MSKSSKWRSCFGVKKAARIKYIFLFRNFLSFKLSLSTYVILESKNLFGEFSDYNLKECSINNIVLPFEPSLIREHHEFIIKVHPKVSYKIFVYIHSPVSACPSLTHLLLISIAIGNVLLLFVSRCRKYYVSVE